MSYFTGLGWRPNGAYGGPAGLARSAPLSLRCRWLAMDGWGGQRKVGNKSPCDPVIHALASCM